MKRFITIIVLLFTSLGHSASKIPASCEEIEPQIKHVNLEIDNMRPMISDLDQIRDEIGVYAMRSYLGLMAAAALAGASLGGAYWGAGEVGAYWGSTMAYGHAAGTVTGIGISGMASGLVMRSFEPSLEENNFTMLRTAYRDILEKRKKALEAIKHADHEKTDGLLNIFRNYRNVKSSRIRVRNLYHTFILERDLLMAYRENCRLADQGEESLFRILSAESAKAILNTARVKSGQIGKFSIINVNGMNDEIKRRVNAQESFINQ